MGLLSGLLSVANPLVGIGATVGSALIGKKANDKAARAQEQAAQAEIDFATESRDLVRGDTAPYRSAGYTALNALMGLSGLPTNPLIAGAAAGVDGVGGQEVWETYNWKKSGQATPYDVQLAFQQFAGRKPTKVELDYYTDKKRARADQLYFDVVESGLRRKQAERQQQFDAKQQAGQQQTGQPAMSAAEMVKQDPSYQFRLDEGMNALQKGAGAAGGLLSGGFAKKALRYSQDYASTEYGKMWDRIATVAGYGTTGAALSSGATMQASGQVGGALSNAGFARASGYVANANNWGNALNEFSKGFGALNPFGGGGTRKGYSDTTPGYS